MSIIHGVSWLGIGVYNDRYLPGTTSKIDKQKLFSFTVNWFQIISAALFSIACYFVLYIFNNFDIINFGQLPFYLIFFYFISTGILSKSIDFSDIQLILKYIIF